MIKNAVSTSFSMFLKKMMIDCVSGAIEEQQQNTKSSKSSKKTTKQIKKVPQGKITLASAWLNFDNSKSTKSLKLSTGFVDKMNDKIINKELIDFIDYLLTF